MSPEKIQVTNTGNEAEKIPQELMRQADTMINEFDRKYSAVTDYDEAAAKKLVIARKLVYDLYAKVAVLLSDIHNEPDEAVQESLLRDLEQPYHEFRQALEGGLAVIEECQKKNLKTEGNKLDKLNDTPGTLDEQVSTYEKIYYSWQNGSDPSTIFTKGWQKQLPKMMSDIEMSLLAAGYSTMDVKRHTRSLWSLLKRASQQADYQTRNLHRARVELHARVSKWLTGRDPNPRVFMKLIQNPDRLSGSKDFEIFINLPDYTESNPQRPEPVATVDTTVLDKDENPEGVETNKPDTDIDKDKAPNQSSPESESMTLKDLAEGLVAAKKEWTDFVTKVPPYHFTFQQDRVNDLFAKLESILNDASCSDEKKVAKFVLYSKHIASLVDPMREYLEGTAANEGNPLAGEKQTPAESKGTDNEVGPVVNVPDNPDATTVVVDNTNPVRDKVFEARKDMGLELYKAKRSMLLLEEQYNEALSLYYKDRTFGQKLRDGWRQLRGKNDGFGEELRTLQQKYDQAADAYKEQLLNKLRFRSQTQAGVTRFQADGELVAKALDERLVIKGQRTVVGKDGTERVFGVKSESEIRETALEEIGRESRMRKLMELMRNNPKATRLVGLGVAAGVGALAGGAPTALMASARWAVATFGGAYAAEKMFQRAQKDVTLSEEKLAETLTNRDKDLSVTERRKLLRTSEADVRKAKVRQRSKAVLTALAVGGSASYGAATVGNYFTPEVATVAPPPTSNEVISPLPPVAEVPLMPFGQINEVTVTETALGAQIVRNIELLSATAGNPIPPAEVSGVFDYVKLATQDILADQPNLRIEQVERLLLERLTNRYGTTEWWKQSGISSIRIGEIESAGLSSAAAAEKIELYTVRPGDSIWRIAEQNNNDLLAKLTPGERNQVLAELRERINQSPKLQQEIGVASGKADLIRVGETLHLNQIEEELRDIIADRPKRGGLNVVGDVSERSIPIRSVPSPVEFNQGVYDDYIIDDKAEVYPSPDTDKAPIIVDKDPMLVHTVEKQSVLPNVTPIDGSYLHTPAYRQFILQNFGSEAAFTRLVEQSVVKFESSTYDFLNRFLQDFRSPFSATPQEILENRSFELSKMTLGEITQWRQQFAYNPEGLRNFAIENGFKYETLRLWLGEVDRLTSAEVNIPHTERTTFGDLYSRSVAERVVMSRAR